MKIIVIATATLMALSMSSASASAQLGRLSPATNDVLVNSLTGGSIDGRLPMIRQNFAL